MKSKWTLYLGLVFLLGGVVLRYAVGGLLPTLLILLGVSLKLSYLVNKVRHHNYKPGTELILLFAGVNLVLSGIYVRSIGEPFNPATLIYSGILLKVLFVVLFIRKIRKGQTAS